MMAAQAAAAARAAQRALGGAPGQRRTATLERLASLLEERSDALLGLTA